MIQVIKKIKLFFKNVFYKKKTLTVDRKITKELMEKINALTDELVKLQSKSPLIVDKIYFFPYFPTVDQILDLLTDLDEFIEQIDLLSKRASDLDSNCQILMNLQHTREYFNYIKRTLEGRYLGFIINQGLYK